MALRVHRVPRQAAPILFGDNGDNEEKDLLDGTRAVDTPYRKV